jgi:hypothetical protein
MKSNPDRKPTIINCHICDKKYHYKYTREELMDLYHPKMSTLNPCIRDFYMDYVWLNYKLEDEAIPKE